MRTNWMKRSVAAVTVAVLATGAVWFAWPRPIAVDMATVTRDAMEVTIDEEAKTRVRHVYTVSAPIAGNGCTGTTTGSASGARSVWKLPEVGGLHHRYERMAA